MNIRNKFLKKLADEMMGMDPGAPVDMGMQATDGTMPMEQPIEQPPMEQQTDMGMQATDGTVPMEQPMDMAQQPAEMGMQANDGIMPQAAIKNKVVVLSKFLNNKIMNRLAENNSPNFLEAWNETMLSETPLNFEELSFKKTAEDANFPIEDINNAPFVGDTAQNDPRFNGQMEQDQMSALNTPSDVAPENDPRYNGGLEANNGMPNEYVANKNNKILKRICNK